MDCTGAVKHACCNNIPELAKIRTPSSYVAPMLNTHLKQVIQSVNWNMHKTTD